MNLGHIEKLHRTLLADVLVEEGVLDRQTVDDAQRQQEVEGKELGQVLLEREILTDYDLAKIVALHYGLPYIDVAGFTTKREVVELLPLEFCLFNAILPLDRFGSIITIAVPEVPTPDNIREIVQRTKLVPNLFVSMRRSIVTILEEEQKRRQSRATPGKGKPAAGKPAAPTAEDAEMDVSQAIPELDLPAISLKLGGAGAGRPVAGQRPAPGRSAHAGALNWMDEAGGGKGAPKKPGSAPAPGPAPASRPASAPAAGSKPAPGDWQKVFENGDAAVKKPK